MEAKLWQTNHELLDECIHKTPMHGVMVAEWLRRWIRNPMGSPRVGSNPAYDAQIFTDFFMICFLLS